MNFGCVASRLHVFVTDENGSYGVIVPQESLKKPNGLPWPWPWYELDGFNSNSPFVEFDLPESGDKGYCFEQGTEYNLWMGEAMLQRGDADNPEDKAYTDIFICPDTTTTTTITTPSTNSSPENEVSPEYKGCYKGLDSAKQIFDHSSGIGGSKNSPLE